MNQCILCGNDSGFGMICSDCKEAFVYYKNLYFTKKTLNETTNLDEQAFEHFCELMDLDTVIKNNITCLCPRSCNETIDEIVPFIRVMLKNDVWMNKQSGRLDAFIEYVKNHIRKYYDEYGKAN